MAMRESPLSPTPQYPERVPVYALAKYASGMPGERGPLRFEEGIATDTDVPRDFQIGASQGYPGYRDRNQKVDTKSPQEVMAARAHVGSAAWIEAPTMLGEFADGADDGVGMPVFQAAYNDGLRVNRMAPNVVIEF